MPAHPYRNSIVWQKAVSLASRVYAVTTDTPQATHHVLFEQMRQSALSVATRIADGAARGTRLDYLRSLETARGSIAELEAQVFVGLELGLVAEAGLLQQIGDLRKLMNALILRLREYRERAASFVLPVQISMANPGAVPPSS